MAIYLYQEEIAASQTDHIMVSPPSGDKVTVYSMIVSCDVAGTLIIEEDKSAGDDVKLKLNMPADHPITLAGSAHLPILFTDEDGADLVITTPAGVVTNITMVYRLVNFNT